MRRGSAESTGCRRRIPTPLHHPHYHYLSEGMIGSDERWKAVEQLELLVLRVVVEQHDARDHRQTRSPTILRKQQRSTCRTRVDVAGHTLFRLRKPGVGTAAAENRPKTPSRAAQDGRLPRRQWRGSSCACLAENPSTPSPAARSDGTAAERRYRWE